MHFVSTRAVFASSFINWRRIKQQFWPIFRVVFSSNSKSLLEHDRCCWFIMFKQRGNYFFNKMIVKQLTKNE